MLIFGNFIVIGGIKPTGKLGTIRMNIYAIIYWCHKEVTSARILWVTFHMENIQYNIHCDT
jgi:hypothetical protein